MSVHKFIKADSPFEIFPRETLQNPNLDCFELGALARICSLPPTWNFSARGLESLLGIGKDKRQALLSKLGQLGFYRCSKRHAQDHDIQGGPSLKIRPGQWVFEHVFSAHGNLGPDGGGNGESSPKADPARAGNSGSGENEENNDENSDLKKENNEPDFPGALFTGAGSAGAGKDGDIDIRGLRDHTPPPPPTPSGGGEDSGGGGDQQDGYDPDLGDQGGEAVQEKTTPTVPGIAELIDAAVWAHALGKAEPIRSLAAWRASVRRRLQEQVTDDDLEAWRAWQAIKNYKSGALGGASTQAEADTQKLLRERAAQGRAAVQPGRAAAALRKASTGGLPGTAG